MVASNHFCNSVLSNLAPGLLFISYLSAAGVNITFLVLSLSIGLPVLLLILLPFVVWILIKRLHRRRGRPEDPGNAKSFDKWKTETELLSTYDNGLETNSGLYSQVLPKSRMKYPEVDPVFQPGSLKFDSDTLLADQPSPVPRFTAMSITPICRSFSNDTGQSDSKYAVQDLDFNSTGPVHSSAVHSCHHISKSALQRDGQTGNEDTIETCTPANQPEQQNDHFSEGRGSNSPLGSTREEKSKCPLLTGLGQQCTPESPNEALEGASTTTTQTESAQLSPIITKQGLEVATQARAKRAPPAGEGTKESPVAQAYLQAWEDQQIFADIRRPSTSAEPKHMQLTSRSPGHEEQSRPLSARKSAADFKKRYRGRRSEAVIEDLKNAMGGTGQDMKENVLQPQKHTTNPGTSATAVNPTVKLPTSNPTTPQFSVPTSITPVYEYFQPPNILHPEQENVCLHPARTKRVSLPIERPLKRTPLADIQYEQVVFAEADSKQHTELNLRPESHLNDPRSVIYEPFQLKPPPSLEREQQSGGRPRRASSSYPGNPGHASVYTEIRRPVKATPDDPNPGSQSGFYDEILPDDDSFVIYEETGTD